MPALALSRLGARRLQLAALRALRVAEVVTVGAAILPWPSRRRRLMARLLSEAITRRVSRPDQRFVFQVSHVPHPVKTIFYLPVAPDPGGQVAGPASLSLVMR